MFMVDQLIQLTSSMERIETKLSKLLHKHGKYAKLLKKNEEKQEKLKGLLAKMRKEYEYKSKIMTKTCEVETTLISNYVKEGLSDSHSSELQIDDDVNDNVSIKLEQEQQHVITQSILMKLRVTTITI